MSAATGIQCVLIVDDDGDMRALIRRMLIRMEVERVIEADSGQNALDQVDKVGASLSLVICDYQMPGMSGVELFSKIHASRPELPFLMLTGRVDVDSVIAAKKAGLSAYLAKPVSVVQLRSKVQSLLSRGHDVTAGGTTA